MAFAITAAETMADAFGMPRAPVVRALRDLRENDTNDWPEGRPRNPAHVEAEHLAMATLAVGVPTRRPMNEAHEWAVRYSRLVPTERHESVTVTTEEGGVVTTHTVKQASRPWDAVEWGNTMLRDALAGMIRTAADPGFLVHMRRLNITVTITGEADPSVSMSHTDPDTGKTITDVYREPRQGELLPDPARATMLVPQVPIPFAAIEVLGALYADTLAHRKTKPTPTPCLPLLPSATSSADPETENAGPLPERPAPNLDHDRDSKASDPVFCNEQSEANGRERVSQALSRGPGRSLNRHRRPHHGRAADSPDRACA